MGKLFMRWHTIGHEENLVQVKSMRYVLGSRQMADVDGIERSTQYTNSSHAGAGSLIVASGNALASAQIASDCVVCSEVQKVTQPVQVSALTRSTDNCGAGSSCTFGRARSA